MKKFLLRCAKKSTAFIMACVMVMTCWVFVAPENIQVHAASASDYDEATIAAFEKYVGASTGTSVINTTYGRYFPNDTDNDANNTAAASIYKNLIYSETLDVGEYAISKSGINLSDNGALANYFVGYPTTVLMDDGVTDPQFGVSVYKAPKNNNTQVFHWGTGVNNSNLSLLGNWRGAPTGALQFLNAYNGGNNNCGASNSSTMSEQNNYNGGGGRSAWFANVIKYTGSVSADTYYEKIAPSFTSKFSQAKDDGCGGSGEYKGVTNVGPYTSDSKYVYVLKTDTWNSAVAAAIGVYKQIVAEPERWTEDSKTDFVTYALALLNASPNVVTWANGTEAQVTACATAMKNAVVAWNAWGGLQVASYTITFDYYAGPNQTNKTEKPVTVKYGETVNYPALTTTADANYHYSYPEAGYKITNVKADQRVYLTYTVSYHDFTELEEGSYIYLGNGMHTNQCSCGVQGLGSGATAKAYKVGNTLTNIVDSSAACNGDWVVETDDTKHKKTCEYCSDVQEHTATGENLKNKVHTDYRVHTATCTEAAKYYVSCTCGISSKGTSWEDTFYNTAGEPASGHTIKTRVNPASCKTKTDGYTEEYCSKCDYVNPEKIYDADGDGKIDYPWSHTGIRPMPENIEDYGDENQHGYFCDTCGDIAEWENHHYISMGYTSEPTCYATGIELFMCNDGCGASYEEEVPKTSHTPGEAEEENRKEATCTVDGSYDIAKYCEICYEEVSRETITLPATGHTEGEAVVENRKEPTCTVDGSYDEVVYCTVCDAEVSRKTITLPATGHTAGEAVEENRTEPTCTDDGSYQSVVYCTVCKAEISRDTVVLDELGHDYESVVTPPTCIDQGYTTHTCSRCGDTYVDSYTATVDHTPGEAVKENIVDKTCTQDGSYDAVIYCTVCNHEISREQTIDPAAHTPGEAVEENRIEPSCLIDGSYDEVVYCSLCGYEISRTQKLIPAPGHTWGDWQTVDGSATDAAGEHIRYCLVDGCGASETADCVNYQVTADVASTCMTKGYTTYICQDCGHGYTVVKELDASNHTGNNHFENGYAATCNKTGYEGDIICECGVKVGEGKTLAIDPDNHNESAIVTEGAKEATCTEQGSTGTKICTDCNKTIQVNQILPIDPDNHVSTTAQEGLAPTCEADGYTAYETCDACHKELGKEVIPATGHDYVGGDAVILDGDVHAYECLNGCGTTGVGTVKGETEACSGGTASCTEKAVCAICNDSYGGLAKHIFEGEYKQVEGTETHNRKCLNCDAYGLGVTLDTGDAEACSGGTATCTDKAQCTLCGGEHGEALGHDFSASHDRVVCNDDRTHSYKCSRCDVEGAVVDGEQITGGTITCKDSEPVITPATCTTRGYTTHVCDICDYTWETDEVQPLGHAYTQKLINAAHLHTAATCTESAVYWYDCARCTKNAKDEEDTDKYTDLTYVYGSPAGHTFNGIDAEAEFIDEEKTIPVQLELCTPATCEDNATYYKYCTVCGVTSKGTAGEETFIDWGSLGIHSKEEIVDDAFLKSEPTCTAKAVYYKSCRACGEISDETFEYGDPLPHMFTEQITDISHRITVATCQSPATYWYDCITCNINASLIVTEETDADIIAALQFTYGELNLNNHTNLVNVPVKNPTCTETGYCAHQKCEDCGTEIGKTIYSKIDHKYTGEYIIANETDADGNIVYMHKRACIYDCGEAASATACSFSDFTQNADGATHSKSCVCGNTVTEDCSSDDVATCTNPVNCDVCGGLMSGATDHAYGEWQSAGDGKRHMRVCANDSAHIEYEACYGGTATACGTMACEVCSQIYKTVAHVWEESDWVVTTEPTCTAAGVETATCDACGLSETRVYGTALGHSYNSGVITAPATCTTDGTKTYTCQRSGCGHSYPETISALKHNMGAWEITTEPTCKDEGVQTKCCQNSWIVDGVEVKCDYTQTQPIPADKSKHVPGDWEVDEANSNCATGLKMVIKCTVCGIVIESKTEPVNHQWISQDIVYGTCTEDGYINFKCDACGMEAVFDNTCETYPNEYLGTIIDAAVAAALPSKGAHKWETELPYGANAIIQNGYVIYVDKAATCGAAGRGRMLCTECGKYSEYVSINKTAHNLKTMAAVAPTCQTPGHEAYQVCRNCPYSEEIVKIPALGHNDANNNGKCDLCGFEMYETDSGSKGCGCMCHSNSWFIAKLIYPIVRFFWKIFGMKHTCNCGAEHY